MKPEVRRRKEVIPTRGGNEIKSEKTIEKIDGAKIWFFENINETDKFLAGLTKKKREEIQVNRI